MSIRSFSKRSQIAASAEEVFAWHDRPGAFERLNPPWDPVEIVSRSGGIQDGARVVVRVKAGPIPQRWEIEHRNYIAGEQFQDIQLKGPFSSWEHTHTFESISDQASWLIDSIEYKLPLDAISGWTDKRLVQSRLELLFQYRHRIISEDIEAHRRYDSAGLKIAITGASGLIGNCLTPYLTTGGHTVTPMVRKREQGANGIYWNYERGEIELAKLEGYDAVIHLAGRSLDGRWTEAVKEEIRASRVEGTRFLATELAKLKQPPKVLVSASAIGYYGNRGAQLVTEQSTPGQSFLASVCEEWEAATKPAADAGIRVVNMRTGVVLDPRGGALAKMLTPFRLGVGGRLGKGEQYMSVIGIDDVLGGYHHALMSEQLSGPVNLVMPRAVTNQEFTKTLGKVLGRPTIFPIPVAIAKAVFGEVADELLLSSTRVEPQALANSNYKFRQSELESLLCQVLGKATP